MKKLFAACLLVFGCTDARWDHEFGKLGNGFSIECYSGGNKIFESKSTGAISSLDGGGYAWRGVDGKYYETFADCIVWYTR
jgi:hypothetical protein